MRLNRTEHTCGGQALAKLQSMSQDDRLFVWLPLVAACQQQDTAEARELIGRLLE